MGLSEKTGNALSDFWVNKDISELDSPIEHKNRMTEIINRSRSAAINRLPDKLTDEERKEFEDRLYEYVGSKDSPLDSEINELNNQYERVYVLLEQSMAVKTKNLHMDWIERLRFLWFRLVTAIGFGAILLLTGYLAKLWEIPLPLLRL